jgi:nucleoside-diphosphate-sugar epimerase
MTRSPQKVGDLRAHGVVPIVCDVFDRDALAAAVAAFRPEVVMHQLTDLPDERERLEEFFPANSRIRTEGTRNLVAAAHAAGARHLIAQSIAWELPGAGGEAVRDHERMILEFGGVIVRYGQFYGPGTYHESDLPDHPRIHVARAAARTVDLIDARSGTYEITDGTGPRP